MDQRRLSQNWYNRLQQVIHSPRTLRSANSRHGGASVKPEACPRDVFLDRDGTLIRNYHYCRDPRLVRLLPGVRPALHWLRSAGYRLFVITNQSGIARGYLTEAELQAVHGRLRQLLAAEGIGLEAIHYCPHCAEGLCEGYMGPCLCRKPEPGMLFRTAAERGISLSQSWYIGDVLADIEAGNRAGCRTVLVDLGTEPRPDAPIRAPTFLARNLPHAVRLILAADGYSREKIRPLPLSALDRPRLSQGELRPGDPSPIPNAAWAIQAALEGAR